MDTTRSEHWFTHPPLFKRCKWLLALVAVLAVGGLLLGVMWPGFTAILPFLYVLPCLLMFAMCIRKGNSL